MARLPAILKSVPSAPLFQHVAEPIDDETVKAVPDWKGCVAAVAANKWGNIGTTIFNRIFAAADATRSADWMSENWNAMVAARSETISQLLEPAIRPLARKHKLPRQFQWTVTGHLMQAWLLTEYPDAPAGAWSERIVRWYLAGHVPCGYSGAVPAGKSSDATRLPDLTRGKLLVF